MASTNSDVALAVMISPTLPAFPAENAGSTYVYRVAEYLAAKYDFVALVPDGPASRRASDVGQVVNYRFFGSEPASAIVQSLEALFRILSPMSMPRRLQDSLLNNPELLDLLRRADVIDLQWAETGSLIGRIRRLNPDAKIICTWHDVLSQKFTRARHESKGTLRKLRWAWAGLAAKSFERKISRETDGLVVLSDKDAALAPNAPAKVEVVQPPLGTAELVNSPRHAGSPSILFVAYLARWENEHGLLWFLEEVLPKIRQQHPTVEVNVAGAGIRANVQAAADAAGVQLLGFVRDLTPLYAAATLAVVPLQLGAGVKFKVVEALLAGVPVVTTPVGAEGIGDAGWYAAVEENAKDFARGVNAVLERPEVAESRSEHIREQVAAIYGSEQFRVSMEHVYALANDLVSTLVMAVGDEEPDVSVVIPTYNGAETIEKQLAALAAQAVDFRFEVVVSDNGSTDDTRAVAARWKQKFSGFKIVDSGQRQGVSYARNEGARWAGSSKVLFCDCDDAAQVNWVKELADALEDYDVVGGAVRMITPSGQTGDVHTSGPSQGLNAVHGFLPYAIGSSIGVNREALLRTGGFDSSYPAGHEEADFSWRVQLAGGSIGWRPGAVLDYVQRSDPKGLFKQNYFYAKSAILLWTRFSDEHELSPVSFKGSIRNLIGQFGRLGLVLSPENRLSYAKDLGWNAGTVAGHLEYRIMRRVPDRQLMEVTG